jgi:hypothetical protein
LKPHTASINVQFSENVEQIGTIIAIKEARIIENGGYEYLVNFKGFDLLDDWILDEDMLDTKMVREWWKSNPKKITNTQTSQPQQSLTQSIRPSFQMENLDEYSQQQKDFIQAWLLKYPRLKSLTSDKQNQLQNDIREFDWISGSEPTLQDMIKCVRETIKRNYQT